MDHYSAVAESTEESFDDVELGAPLVGQATELSCGAGDAQESQRGAGRNASATFKQLGGAAAGGAGSGSSFSAAAGAYVISTSPRFIELEVTQPNQLSGQLQPQQKAAAPRAQHTAEEGGKARGGGTAGAAASKPASRAASFSLRATSGRASAFAGSGAGAASASASTAAGAGSPPVSTAAAAWPDAAEAQVEAEGGPAAAAAGAGGGGAMRARLSAMAVAAAAAAPRAVPVCSVLFSLVSGILAVIFFTLFLAHHDSFEETGCTLLLTAASATAGPASLLMTSVREPAILVCLGKEEEGPRVAEDSLAALLAAHPHVFSDAQAQLSFTPAGSAARWDISLEVKGISLNASAGAGSSAWIQVDDWEAAAAADSGTIYPGTEAFEAQFGAGVPLGQPLLVFRLDDEELVRK